jgi:hypothetical protein
LNAKLENNSTITLSFQALKQGVSTWVSSTFNLHDPTMTFTLPVIQLPMFWSKAVARSNMAPTE